MNELIEEIERLRLEMMALQPRFADPLRQLEALLLHERDATLKHIRHVAAIKTETEAMIRGELEALREVLIPAQTPPPIPSVEDRYTRPRFLSEVA